MSPYRSQRLSNKVFSAFNQACDADNLEVARSLMAILDNMLGELSAVVPDRRKAVLNIVAAHERLWLLMHSRRPT